MAGLGQLRIKRSRFGGRSAAAGERLDPEHPHGAPECEAQNVADPHRSMGAVDDAAVDPEPSFFGEGLRLRTRLHDPREPEEFVEP